MFCSLKGLFTVLAEPESFNLPVRGKVLFNAEVVCFTVEEENDGRHHNNECAAVVEA